jgi:hypothetical protein
MLHHSTEELEGVRNQGSLKGLKTYMESSMAGRFHDRPDFASSPSQRSGSDTKPGDDKIQNITTLDLLELSVYERPYEYNGNELTFG